MMIGSHFHMNAALTYFDKTSALLEKCGPRLRRRSSRPRQICANSIANGGLVFLFGNGHSRMMCEEMTPRQGCYRGLFRLGGACAFQSREYRRHERIASAL